MQRPASNIHNNYILINNFLYRAFSLWIFPHFHQNVEAFSVLRFGSRLTNRCYAIKAHFHDEINQLAWNIDQNVPMPTHS